MRLTVSSQRQSQLKQSIHHARVLVELNKLSGFVRLRTSDLEQHVLSTNLKSQCEQREGVQGCQADLSSDVGFEKRLVNDIRL